MTEHRILDRPDGAFRELLDALERSHGDSGSGGRGNGDDDGGNGGGRGDDGDRFRAFAKLFVDALGRVGAVQAEALRVVTADVREMALRGDELVAKTMGEAVMKSISQSADIAEHVASLAARVHALEAEVERLRGSPAAAERGSLQ